MIKLPRLFVLSKNGLIDYLDLILDSNMAQTKTYLRWCRGFGPELDAKKRIQSRGFEPLPTGWFLYYQNSKNKNPTKCTYCTMSDKSIDEQIVNLYAKFSKYADRLFYIQYSFDQSKVDLIEYTIKDSNKQNIVGHIPKLDIKLFQFINGEFISVEISNLISPMDEKRMPVCNRKGTGNELRYLESYDYSEILDIYAQRYLLSNILRECKGYACDIDHIGFLDDELIIIESKSKDPANKKLKRDGDFNNSSNWYFGWDWRRFAHYMELYYNTGINTVYLIEELDDQKNRKVVGYKSLQLSEILKQSSWGEGGDTNNIPYDAFNDFLTL